MSVISITAHHARAITALLDEHDTPCQVDLVETDHHSLQVTLWEDRTHCTGCAGSEVAGPPDRFGNTDPCPICEDRPDIAALVNVSTGGTIRDLATSAA